MHEQLLHMSVQDVMDTWPRTVPVFVRHRMACPGCALAQFMTVTEAALEYKLEPAALTVDLIDAIEERAPDSVHLR